MKEGKERAGKGREGKEMDGGKGGREGGREERRTGRREMRYKQLSQPIFFLT